MKKCILLTILFSINVLAQSGPNVPCVGCENFIKLTTPVNGLWYNPEQSGVGISIELQKNTLFGAYYGYDETGDAVWYTFLGELSKSSDPETMWEFEASLKQFKNGTCPNCEYQPPETVEIENTIQFKFKHKNHASFSINKGEQQFIVPITFASSATADFAEITSYKIPNLAGFWNFRYRKHEDDWWEGVGFSELLAIGHKVVTNNDDGTTEVNFDVAQWFPLELVFIGDITCKTILNDSRQIVGPECIYNSAFRPYYDDPFREVDFNFPLSGLGDQRIFGESVEGHSFEAIRVDLEEYHEDAKNSMLKVLEQL